LTTAGSDLDGAIALPVVWRSRTAGSAPFFWDEEETMTPAVATKNTAMSKAEAVARLNQLAEQLTQMGFADEAERAREIAKEVCALRGG
jgi:hypothetical protein